jgi:hypothetical protein
MHLTTSLSGGQSVTFSPSAIPPIPEPEARVTGTPRARASASPSASASASPAAPGASDPRG